MVALALALASAAHAQDATDLAHTYSIVAIDPEAGLMGVAVQSHWLAVGSLCAWAEPGVGVVATQAKTSPRYGTLGLAGMRRGEDPAVIFAALAAEDPHASARQVAMLDARGRGVTHTGPACIAAAGHERGPHFSVQANMMVDDQVVPTMARAFRDSEGPLAERLLATLRAAQAAGGDMRGAQAAAMVVVRTRLTGDPYRDRPVDLRVDDHPRPVEELARLLGKRRTLDGWGEAEGMLHAGRTDAAEAHFEAVAAAAPDNHEIRFWFGLSLAQAGRWTSSRRWMHEVFTAAPGWVTALERLPGTSVLPDREAGLRLVNRILRRDAEGAR